MLITAFRILYQAKSCRICGRLCVEAVEERKMTWHDEGRCEILSYSSLLCPVVESIMQPESVCALCGPSFGEISKSSCYYCKIAP